MKDRFNRFMSGRYGADDFSKFLLAVSVVIMLLNLGIRIELLNAVVVAIFFYIYIRMFSTNIDARYRENQKYLALQSKVLSFFDGLKSGSGQSGYRIFKCPSCGQKIRIPKGKGKIVVTCPKCKTEFTRKS